jgi:hypothetical protein
VLLEHFLDHADRLVLCIRRRRPASDELLAALADGILEWD